MKKIVFGCVFLLMCLNVLSQFTQVAESAVFEEPEEGFCKVLQMKNGNTMFFHLKNKKGMSVRAYDISHKLIAEKQLETSLGKLKAANVDGFFEVNGNAVLLVSEFESATPVLTRIIVNGTTGALIEDKEIARMDKVSMGMGYGMALGAVALPDFSVRKDPFSDNYAVVMFNTVQSDRNKRIELVLYGADNKEIKRVNYNSPENKFKYLHFIDMAFFGRNNVALLVSAYNTKESGSEQAAFLLGTLEEGDKEIKVTRLDVERNLGATGGIARYNPVTKKLILLTTTRLGRKEGSKNGKTAIDVVLTFVDPVTKTMEHSEQPVLQDAFQKHAELFGKKDELTVGPQNIYINSDGSFAVLFEELKLYSRMGSMGGWSGSSNTANNQYQLSDAELGHAVVANYSILGTETGSYLFPRSQHLERAAVVPFYQSEREGTAQKMDRGNQYKSCYYLPAKNGSYMLMNDAEKNTESIQKGKITKIVGVSDCDAFYYRISGSDIVPGRVMLYGDPGKKSHNLSIFTISDYDASSNQFVTLKLENERGDKGVKLVWLQPQ
ncbi:hypothetical protein [Flavihumibacter petaseus]|uniref:Phosphodiester glycosidase domain-containing protein n=1 Tax=Flavihumibacter petaseus NBRC 106054 TaxID=1220578 RepID=A0A0E9N027_9BACT|nr:hypothetical protein [Flavihumibacter petaseus]GAO42981.1 hypothetical protein FPE01S_02_00860 [Flavihumibacter petaseus NBRC 106054]